MIGNITWGNNLPTVEAEVNFDSIVDALPDEPNKGNNGIYHDGHGNIAINASAIKTGTI